jgi:hypothetical protein
MKNSSSAKRTLVIILLGLLLIAIGVGAQTIPPSINSYQTQPTATPTTNQPNLKEYIHPSNTFSLMAPSDWKVTENKGYVLFSSPDETAYVEIFAENTIDALNAERFSQAIDSLEHNVFSGNKNYKETNREIQKEKGYAIISKSFDINKVPFQCSTIYEIKEKALYVESYYSAVSAVAKTGPIFSSMDSSFKSNPAYVEDLDPFTSGPFTYNDPDGLYSLLAPSLWTYEDAKKNGAVITLASPDQNAYIMLVKEIQGKTVTRAIADKRTLDFLRALYSDIRIDKTEVLPNGSIIMSWAPKSGGLQAASIYKWSGKVWFILTWMANTGFEKTYGPAFNQSMDTYTLPK